MIRVVVAEVGKAPEAREIDGSLESFQKIVGGYIEAVRRVGLPQGMDLFVNEEGRLHGMPFNRYVAGFDLLGPIVIAASDDEGETTSLSDDQIDFAIDLLKRAAREVS